MENTTGVVISPTLIAGAVFVAIIVIVGYIIAKKKQVKLKWWFPLAAIVILYAIMLIVSFVLHFVFKVIE